MFLCFPFFVRENSKLYEVYIMSSKRAKRNFVAFKSKKRYQRFLDKMNCEIKNKSISLQFKIKEVKPEFEDDLDYEINEEGTEGLYDLVDRESSVPWREFDKEQTNFYEQSFYITEIIEE